LDAETGRRTVLSVVHVQLSPPSPASNGHAGRALSRSAHGHNGDPSPLDAWHDSPDAETLRRAAGLEHAVESVLPLRGVHVAAWLSVGRAAGRRFTPRQHALLEALHGRCAGVYAADLRLVSPDVLALTAEQRHCLQYLFAGDGEKQVARRLRLTESTVHDHVQGACRSLGLSGRDGLLAECGRSNGNPVG
jgi:DNA-binding CsgD family transcriptional regulator